MLKKLFKRFLRREDSKKYLRDPYERLIKATSYIVDNNILKRTLFSILKESIPCPVILYLFERGERAILSEKGFPDLNLRSNDRLIKWLCTNKKELYIKNTPYIFSYLSEKERDFIKKFGIEICLPLFSLNRLIGIVFLGKRDDGKSFSEEDLIFLRFFSYHASIALGNTLLLHEKRENLSKMVRADRLALIGQIASSVAHEIKNPLTTIKSTIQYIRKGFEAQKSEFRNKIELIDKLLDETDRIDSLIRNLLTFSRIEETRMEEIELVPFTDSILQLIEKNDKIKVKRNYSCKPKIRGDRSQLKQVLLNIFLNSLDAMPDGGEIEISIETLKRKERLRDEDVLIRIKDSGIGIPQENIEKIFDPFFTTKKDGTGLGLWISYGIVKRHGGEIDVRSEVGKGTEVILRLPV